MDEKAETIDPRIKEWMAELEGYELSDTATMAILCYREELALCEKILKDINLTKSKNKIALSVMLAALRKYCPELEEAFKGIFFRDDSSNRRFYCWQVLLLERKALLHDRMSKLLKNNRKYATEEDNEV